MFDKRNTERRKLKTHDCLLFKEQNENQTQIATIVRGWRMGVPDQVLPLFLVLLRLLLLVLLAVRTGRTESERVQGFNYKVRSSK